MRILLLFYLVKLFTLEQTKKGKMSLNVNYEPVIGNGKEEVDKDAKKQKVARWSDIDLLEKIDMKVVLHGMGV